MRFTPTSSSTAARRRFAPAAGIVALLLSAAPTDPIAQDDPWPGPHDVGDAAGAQALTEARQTWSDRASWEARSGRLRRHLDRLCGIKAAVLGLGASVVHQAVIWLSEV